MTTFKKALQPDLSNTYFSLTYMNYLDKYLSTDPLHSENNYLHISTYQGQARKWLPQKYTVVFSY